MPISITPLVTPEVTIPSKSFDRMWIRSMMVDAPDVNGAVRVDVVFKAYRRGEDGVGEFYVDEVGNQPEYRFSIPNAVVLLASNPEQDAAVGVVLDAIAAIRREVAAEVGTTANALSLIELITQALGAVAKTAGLFA